MLLLANTAQIKGIYFSSELNRTFFLNRDYNYFQNDCAALNFMVRIEAILQICRGVNPQACSFFTCRMSRPAMRLPCRFFTNFSSLTECVLYIRVVYFACRSRLLNAQARKVGVFITRLRAGPRVMFERGGIVKLLGEDAFHENINTVVERLTQETRR